MYFDVIISRARAREIENFIRAVYHRIILPNRADSLSFFFFFKKKVTLRSRDRDLPRRGGRDHRSRTMIIPITFVVPAEMAGSCLITVLPPSLAIIVDTNDRRHLTAGRLY